jgi:hypothetical protein
MPRATPLLPLSLLTPRASRLASSSLAPRRVSTMCWHARVCRMTTLIHSLSSSPPRRRRTDKIPTPRVPSRHPLLPSLCSAPRELTSALRRDEPSPLSLLAQARVAPRIAWL